MTAVLLACAQLRAGQPHEVLATLAGEAATPSVESLRLAATGLVQEAAGDPAAARSFSTVAEIGVPLPDLLQVTGAALQRLGERALAYECFSVLDPMEPGALARFVLSLPVAEQVRYAPVAVQALLRAERPLFYPLQPLKAELVRQLNPEPAALAYAQAMGSADAEIGRRAVVLLPDHALTHGEGLVELAARRELLLPAPDVFGQSPAAPQLVRTRWIYRTVLRDVVVSGKSNLLHLPDSVLLDAHQDELALYPHDLDVDPAVMAPTDSHVVTILRPPTESLGSALSLVGVHTYNFGHWLVEFLPKVWACLDQPGFENVTVLIDEQMHPGLRPALEAFLRPGHPIRVLRPGESVHVDRLWTLPMITYLALGPRAGASETDEPMSIDADLLADLLAGVEPILNHFDPPGGGGRRLYLSRGDDQHRRLVNRLEVEALVKARGFDVYDPGSLTFDEQLRRVRSARTIMGPDGSALWLALLARAGTRVGYLNNPFLEEHWWLSASHRARGMRMLVLTGRVVKRDPNYRKFSDYEIDLGELASFLDALERP